MDRPETELVRPAALSRGAVEALVTAQLGDRAEEGTAAAAHETSGGNPLLLRELVPNLEGQPGMTNREIAETLFVTQKTIEVRLGNTYGKLGIRSRNQLQAALEGAGSV